MGTWVNFKRLREEVHFAQVLDDLGVDVTVKSDQAIGHCPLPGHQAHSKRRSKSFSVNLERNIFQCFGCQAKGNVLDFWALMSGHDPEDKEQFRAAALDLQSRFLGGGSADAGESDQGEASKPAKEESRPVIVNAPLPFELQGLNPDHEYLRKRGLRPETVKHFGLGYCSRGLMARRVVIPLHDSEGQLIGYAGRIVDDHKIDDDNPKYRLPGPRERDGKVHELHKSEFLFNGHRFPRDTVGDLIVVEGFFGAIWLHQLGHENVVALMGSSISSAQARLITEFLSVDGTVWMMPDGDEAGEKCAVSVFEAVGTDRAVRWAKMPGGRQPDDLDSEDVELLLDPWAQ
jgi:DNA primase